MKLNKFEKMYLGDNNYFNVEGRGSMKVHLPNGKIRHIEEVHVLDLRINLNSIGKAIDFGYDISFTSNQCFIKK
jgi:hypothetical protein